MARCFQPAWTIVHSPVGVDLLKDHDCTMLCVYDLAYTPSSLVSDILATHPYAVDSRQWDTLLSRP